MKMFTIQEFADICGGISYNGADKKIDSLIKKVKEGKLNGEIDRKEELIDGKLTKVVYISSDLLNLIKRDKVESKITKFSSIQSENNELNPAKFNKLDLIKSNNFSHDFMENIISELITTQKQLVSYAEQAGQVKLLTDNSKFYQDEYFKLKYGYEQLTQLNNSNIETIKKLKLFNEKKESEKISISLKLTKLEDEIQNKINDYNILYSKNGELIKKLSEIELENQKLKEENTKLKQELDKKPVWMFWQKP